MTAPLGERQSARITGPASGRISGRSPPLLGRAAFVGPRVPRSARRGCAREWSRAAPV